MAMRSSRLTLLCSGVTMTLFLGVSTAYAQKAQYTPQDVVKAFSAPSETSAPKDPGCPANTAPGDDGVCDPIVETRGFSLADPRDAHKPAKRAKVARASARAAPQRARTRLASAAVSPGDLLINFRTGSSELTGQSMANAKVFATALNSPALAGARFEISGHTDSQGAAAKNEALSVQRAQAVRAQLVAYGVDGSRLNAKGYGASRPVAGLAPRAAANRRVEAQRLDNNS